MPSNLMINNFKVNNAFTGTPSTPSLPWVSLARYTHLTILVAVTNSATVTGVAVALSQATAVAGTSAKTLAFTKAWRNLDLATNDTMSEFTVASNTFNTDTTNSRRMLYQIEIDQQDLDMDNDFDCVRLTLTGAAVAQVVGVVYVLGGCRHAGDVSVLPSAITD